MIVLNTKTFEELQNESLAELTAVGFNSSAGTISRLFMSIINKNVDSLYRVLTTNHLRAFLSTTDGNGIDAIGALLNCSRLSRESDEDYKYRVSQQCLVLASSNEVAVRLAVLCTEGVADTILKKYAMGAGTFSVIIVLEDGYNKEDVIANVKDSIDKTDAYGIKYNVITPTLTYIKFKMKLYIKDNVSDADAQTIRYDVQIALSDYISNLDIGEGIVIDQLTQAIMNVSDNIISHQCLEFKINGERALYVNQSCRWFERFALSTDVDNIVIS